ncbi:MAG: hypothetical protein RLZ25_1494 [Pseudomonadota bacterium]
MSKSPKPKVLILGYGNPSRGDDALGPELIAQLESLMREMSLFSDLELTLLTDFQLQVEHALDLQQQDLVLLVDAHINVPPPFLFARVSADAVPSFSTHSVSPGTLLKVAEDLHGTVPPTYLIGIRGYQYELGESLSTKAQEHLAQALAWILALLNRPESAIWDTLLGFSVSESRHSDADPRSPLSTSTLVQSP